MPRKKKEAKPVRSSDLQESGESILEGIHHDPFEPSIYVVEGLIPEFIDLGQIANLADGPAILKDGLWVLQNPETRPAKYTITLVLDVLLAQMQASNTKKREYLQAQSKDGRLWLSFDLDPGDTKSFKLLVSTYGGAKEVTGQLIFEAKFL